LDLNKLDLDEIALGLSDQTDYEHQWLINRETGEIAFWTSDTGIDGQHPVDLDELDLVVIDPLPSSVWYQDMADFVDLLRDEAAVQRLARAIRGRGAFRRFKDELHEEYPDLVPVWYAFRDTRARRRAVEWLLDEGLITEDAAATFRRDNPDPDVSGTASEDASTIEMASLVLFANDLAESAAFYRTIGVPLEDEHHGGGPVHAAAEVGGMHFAIYQAEQGIGTRGDDWRSASTVFPGFYVASLDAVTEALRSLGVRLLTQHQVRPWGCRIVAEDPDGHAVEINQRGHCA